MIIRGTATIENSKSRGLTPIRSPNSQQSQSEPSQRNPSRLANRLSATIFLRYYLEHAGNFHPITTGFQRATEG